MSEKETVIILKFSFTCKILKNVLCQFSQVDIHSLPFKKLFDAFWNKEVVNEGGPVIHHFIDHVDLRNDRLPSGILHQGPDVTDSQTNQEVHDDNREQ